MAKAPLDVRSLARQHTAAANASLAGIATNGKSESARVAACDVLLQRGWGRLQQDVVLDREIRVTIRKMLTDADELIDLTPDRPRSRVDAPAVLGLSRHRHGSRGS